jgi:hypothetical protein
MQFTRHSLKAPGGFQPLILVYEVKNWFQNLGFQIQLRPLHRGRLHQGARGRQTHDFGGGKAGSPLVRLAAVRGAGRCDAAAILIIIFLPSRVGPE